MKKYKIKCNKKKLLKLFINKYYEEENEIKKQFSYETVKKKDKSVKYFYLIHETYLTN